MIIDFHTHVFPDELAPRAISTLKTNAPEMHNFTDGTAAGLKESMRKNGIEKSIIMQIATRPSHVRTINQDACTRSDDKLLFFGTLHPADTNFVQEIRFLKDVGVPGVKFHPEYQDFYVDSPQMFPFYEALEQAGLIVLFHAGKDPGPFTSDHALPEALRAVTRNFPRLKMVAAHMGGWQVWEDVEQRLAGENTFFDTSAINRHLPKAAFEQLVAKHGAERVLFGSDSPWYDQGEALRWLDSTSLSARQKELIFWQNARNLLSGSVQ
ncbi:MAG: amidohydrolase family protein [Chitinivibrionales bacterium]